MESQQIGISDSWTMMMLQLTISGADSGVIGNY